MSAAHRNLECLTIWTVSGQLGRHLLRWVSDMYLSYRPRRSRSDAGTCLLIKNVANCAMGGQYALPLILDQEEMASDYFKITFCRFC